MKRTLNKELKIFQDDGIIFNYSYYKDDGMDYMFYLDGRYIGFVAKSSIELIIEKRE